MISGSPLLTLDIILSTDDFSDRPSILSTMGVLRANQDTLLMRSTYEELLVERASILTARGRKVPEDHELSWYAVRENNWNPSYESSLYAWYSSEALALASDGTTIEAAEDRSGNKFDLYQTDTGDQPVVSGITALNGFKGILFSNSQALYHDPAENDPAIGSFGSEVDASEEGLCLAVMLNYGVDEGAGANVIFGLNADNGGSGAAGDWVIKSRDNSSNEIYRTEWNNVNLDNPAATIPNGNDFVVFGPVSASGFQSNVNGTDIVTNVGAQGDIASGRLLNMGGMVNGGSAVANGFNGTVYEAIIFKEYNNTELRQKIEGYFAHKYAVTANLPSDHPYKTTPPLSKG